MSEELNTNIIIYIKAGPLLLLTFTQRLIIFKPIKNTFTMNYQSFITKKI